MRLSLVAAIGAVLLATPALAQLAPDIRSDAVSADPAADPAIVQAADQTGDFYCQRKLGTWFYCDKPKARPRTQTEPPVSQQSAADQMKAITAQLDEL